ncbi:NAD(P)-binding protein [Nibrella viscosa]
MNAYDVIIGSGVNALTAGVVLARQGKSVAIFERNDWLGGNILTEETVFPGFKTDILSAYHTMFVTGPAYIKFKEELTANGLRYRNTPAPTASSMPGKSPDDAKSIIFFTDRQKTIAEVNRHTPGNGNMVNTVVRAC